MFVDSHCHLDRLKKSESELIDVVAAAEKRRVEHMLCVAVSVKEFEDMRNRVKGFDNVSMSCGVHPLHNEDVCSFDELLSHVSRDDVVAVGETGLDYFYSAETRDVQKASFVDHIIAANKVKKPLIIHTRDAREDTISLLKEHKEAHTTGVLHCFTESLEMAQEAMELGFYISISGIVTFSSASELRETVKQIPLNRLLIETDSPWLAPVPHRGKENEPANVVDVAYFIAELKGITVAELAKATTENFYTLFSHINK
ncbi:TatD family hydrolase [Brumicola blandensis]|uniref:YchF/TatD family DNA exonuclease n=1 Tax=Brumicola blandensis TaxID=3075611 RepID=A0AAW8QWG6_9ALTE|nr:YchF/TatD family DNA exonuclease [Alteromonas sp. W409]MDT0581367.1 YchF/TatD family DNA exonuclease [Alteromonas sp. W409]